MSKKSIESFFNDVDFANIIDNIKGIYTSDASMSTLLDFERVLDEANLYAFKNWELGELVDGPDIKKYKVACIFMYPRSLMPDPRGAKRLLKLGCNVQFKKTKIKVPVQIKQPDDFKPGTHYPKMVEREIWLIRIEMPTEIMDDIREGSIDLAGQTIDLDDLDSAYDDDLDKESTAADDDEESQGQENAQQPALGQQSGMGMM